jgi:PAS domain S-box-containing protein
MNHSAEDQAAPAADRFVGGGEMGAMTRAFDWARTPLGPVEAWPPALASTLGICLTARFPMAIYWGREGFLLYNDAWRPILGDKHPWALGRAAQEVWPEIWDAISPVFESVRATGEATWRGDELLPMRRFGYTEECYFDYTFNPIRGQSGEVEGILNVVLETTYRVLNDRRAHLLRELAARAGSAQSEADACEAAVAALATDAADVPFVLLYLVSPDGRRARLAASAGLPAGHPARVSEVDLAADPASGAWPLADALGGGKPMTVDDLAGRFGEMPGGQWPEPTAQALVLPVSVAGQEGVAALLVAGVNPRRALDDDYRHFFAQVAAHVATALTNARAYEGERRRAEALAELDRAKTAFFSNVSHEFRTPLTLLLGPLEDALGQGGGALPGETREQLEVARRNGLRLLKLVNTLLDFSRLEAGRVEAAYEPVELGTYTADLASNFRSAVEKAGLKLIVDCPPLDEPVYVDREMWEKVVFNLLSNALKFTFAGEIEVRLRRVSAASGTDSVALSVRDTGTGIPEAELPRLFERFHRVKGAESRSHEGTGIGLALVQELARLHGGEVAVESEVGRGSTFTVSVPLGSSHLPAERVGAGRKHGSAAPRTEIFVKEALRWLPEGSGFGVQSSEFAGEAPPTWPNAEPTRTPNAPRVLLADDNADMREYVRRLLGQSYEVEAVGDGAAALEAARARPPDLVLTDVMMPRLDGFGLLRELRADERTRTVPVILLSARAGEEAKVEGMEAGADDYLVKPFGARELLARVDAHVRLHRVRREAQAALRASEAKFSTAFDRSPLALTITSLDDGRLVEVNEGFVRMSGYAREEAVGRTPEELGLWVEPEQRAARFAQLRAGAELPNVEARFRLKGGEERIGVIGSALVEINSRPCVLSSVVDVTERKQSEEAVRRSREQLQIVSDNTPALISYVDRECRYRWCNRAYTSWFGLPAEQVVGRPMREVLGEEAWQTIGPRVAAALAGEPVEYEAEAKYKAGGTRWIHAVYTPHRDDAGAVLGVVVMVSDVTERKRSEEAAARLAAIVESSDDAIISKDLGGVIRSWNRGAERLFGYAAAEAVGQPVVMLIPPDRLDEEAHILERIRRGEQVAPYETVRRRKDGTDVDVSLAVSPIRNPAGEIIGASKIARDITARKRAEAERDRLGASLRASDERYRAFVAQSSEAIWRFEVEEPVNVALPPDEQIELFYRHAYLAECNDAMARMYGYASSEEIVGARLGDFMPREDAANTAYLRAFIASGYRLTEAESHEFDRDGNTRYFLNNLIGFVEDEGEGGRLVRAWGTQRDITARRRMEETLRESEERFRHMADHAPVMVWVTEAAGTCTYLSKSWYEFTGQTPETGLGFGWLDATHPDDRAEAERVFFAATERREAFRLEYRLRRGDGGYAWAIDSAAPRFGPGGEFLGFIGSVIDITERKQMEDALREADRRKDEFLAMLAHELRNPLAPVRNAVQVMRALGPAEPRLEWAREVIDRQVSHLTRLVDDLLDVSRITRGKITLEKEPVELAAVVLRAVESVRPLVDARRQKLVVVPPPASARVEGDATRLAQVVSNLLNNAAKYTDPGGEVRLSAGVESGAAGAAEAVIRVRDNGIGMRRELLPHVFDLFAQDERTLDRSQGGLGIGLTIVRRLVELHGGRVEASSDGPGRGSEFTVRLPLAAAQGAEFGAETLERRTPNAEHRTALRVLVVDDNVDSAESMALLLSIEGYETRMAHDGQAALRAAEEFAPDAILLDIGLPVMDGYEVARRLRERPEMPPLLLVALTGYGQERDRQLSREAGFDYHLVKPVEPEKLSSLLAELQAGKGRAAG